MKDLVTFSEGLVDYTNEGDTKYKFQSIRHLTRFESFMWLVARTKVNGHKEVMSHPWILNIHWKILSFKYHVRIHLFQKNEEISSSACHYESQHSNLLVTSNTMNIQEETVPQAELKSGTDIFKKTLSSSIFFCKPPKIFSMANIRWRSVYESLKNYSTCPGHCLHMCRLWHFTVELTN